MKFNRSLWLVALAAAFTARADLSGWIQDLGFPSQLHAVFFRSVPMPGGPIGMRRPPKETRAELAKLISAAPADVSLYALRAREDEMQLDFAAAEQDWKRSGDSMALADFYHRRILPDKEIATLEIVGRSASTIDEQSLPANQQVSWKAFERIQDLIARQALSAAVSTAGYRAWVSRYPREPVAYRRFFNAMLDGKQFADAEKVLQDYRRAFPADSVYPVQATASLAARRGGPDDALRVYDAAFQPLWPNELVTAYFERLTQAHALRKFLEAARAAAAAKPLDIGPPAKLFYYHREAGRPDAAARALLEFRQRKAASKSPWAPEELWTLGQLFEAVHSYDDAARSYYELYETGVAEQERALAAIADLLLTVPDQPIRIGAGSLSTYRDVAALDPGPGFLNGVLSLLFNSSYPVDKYDTENQVAAAYFHRAAASDLIGRFGVRYPNSSRRASLQAKLISAYVAYGDDSAVVKASAEFLRIFPKAPERVQVALQLADTYARQSQQPQEFAVYDAVLKELGAGGPGYSAVLDRYLARLAATKRVNEALILYRREIDRNPNEAKLYERLAGFLEQNKLDAQIEQVYRNAIARFQDKSWSHKLARFYLRRRQTSQFDSLTRDVAKIFSGSELESYLADVGQSQPLGPVLYRQVNIYAHRRFPHNIAFVRNLLEAYRMKGTADPAAREALLRETWYYAPDLRDRFFELLSLSGKLKSELSSLSTPNAELNPAAALFAAEGEAWQSHFEAAAPLFRAASAQYPGDTIQLARAASIFRSLATLDGPGDFKNTEIAAQLQLNVSKADPRGQAASILVGEIYADRERFGVARPYWDRIASIEPGSADGYLAAATVFWDYYRFDDAERLIGDGRKRLASPHLFSYEAGAIAENRRDYDRAVREYLQGALLRGDAAPRGRLIALSKRPAQRSVVEQLTANAASAADANLAAVSLRTDVLAAQDRIEELAAFLIAAARTNSAPEVIQFVDDTAAARGLDAAREQAKLRALSLATDPVERMRISLEVLRFYEARKDAIGARRIVDDLYRANPTILGVVRAAVDYAWRSGDRKRAVDLLDRAAAKAQPSYRVSFLLEASRKAAESEDYPRARALLAGLLAKEPLRSEYVAAMADTYARQGDDKGLRDFYSDRLRSAGKLEKAAELRRGLIPVLTRLRDFSGAVDQYIEILNRFPEDAALTREASLYALRNAQAARLLAYYRNTQTQSPKDYRWALLEARIQVHLEDFPAAVAAYRKASALRPDRVEFYSERAGLEERLLRFDEAASTYSKLYDLTYHNSQWMDKAATVRARQGLGGEAVKALSAAYLDGRPAKPDGYFVVARKLEGWSLLSQAREFASRGVDLAGPEPAKEYPDGARTYTRIMTRLREYNSAFQKVGPATLAEMGAVVREYYTPEEKSAFAAFAAARLSVMSPAVQAAGLVDLQARAAENDMQVLVPLQQRRLRYNEVAMQLEAYWRSLAPQTDNRDSYLVLAAENYRLAGNGVEETRILGTRYRQGEIDDRSIDRASLLIARSNDWQDAVGSVKTQDRVRDSVVNQILSEGPADKALRAIAARGRGLASPWVSAYTALVGLFYGVNTPSVSAAFAGILGPSSIGSRMAKTSTKAGFLTGDLWYYYGSRYGEYLDATKQSGSDDYLPALVEARPGSADAYFDLGEYYASAGYRDNARDEYSRVLQLSRNRIDVHNRLAALSLEQGRREDAAAEFRAAVAAASRVQDAGRVPQDFWSELLITVEGVEKAKLLDSLRSDLDRLLRTYVRRNGRFQLEEILPHLGVPWAIQLSAVAPEPVQFLSALVKSDWVSEPARSPIYDELLRASARKPEMAQDLRKYRLEYVKHLLASKRGADARRVLAQVSDIASQPYGLIPLEVGVAAQTGSLSALIRRYESDPGLYEKLEALRNGATELELSGDRSSAGQVLEFVYSKQLQAGQLDTGAFLGLAEIRLSQGDVAAAVALLRRMTMLCGEPFEALRAAGDLLVRNNRPAEAISFLSDRVKATPWDSEARMELAKLGKESGRARELAVSRDLRYGTRVAAARWLREVHAAPLSGTSAELILLSSSSIPPQASEKPYFVFARLDAALRSLDPLVQVRLLQGAIAIDPLLEKPRGDLVLAAVNSQQWQVAVSTALLGESDTAVHLALGRAHESLGELDEAGDAYRLARSEPDRQRVAAAIRLRDLNESRRPLVSKDLGQDRPVRPRLSSAGGGSR